MKVKVRAIPERGFRRAGMAFTREEKIVDVDKKTLEILKSEQMLVVVEMPEEKPPKPEGKDTGKGGEAVRNSGNKPGAGIPAPVQKGGAV